VFDIKLQEIAPSKQLAEAISELDRLCKPSTKVGLTSQKVQLKQWRAELKEIKESVAGLEKAAKAAHKHSLELQATDATACRVQLELAADKLKEAATSSAAEMEKVAHAAVKMHSELQLAGGDTAADEIAKKITSLCLREESAGQLGWFKPDTEFFEDKARQLEQAKAKKSKQKGAVGEGGLAGASGEGEDLISWLTSEEGDDQKGLCLQSTLNEVAATTRGIRNQIAHKQLLDIVFHQRFNQVIEITAALGGDVKLARELRNGFQKYYPAQTYNRGDAAVCE
jgi:hypothetical protein